MNPYQVYSKWLFDGNKTSPIPKATENVDILKYNSPITHVFVLQMFMRHGPLNYYLDKYFNNFNLRYLEKEELFHFIKKCVMDFRVMKKHTVYYKYRQKNKLFDELRGKYPELKNNDLSLLCDIIEDSEDRDRIYDTLGLVKPPKKEKIKIGKKRKIKDEKITQKDFLDKHFSIL